ncbi:MAG: cation:dicarboxylase symporter family transporter [Bacteroidetes bacterium]|jgi:Na+/H+-dicarboxylate symporter|nr:cation:dicarboxylase symporter family transporter [Bacteroidota bacterium]
MREINIPGNYLLSGSLIGLALGLILGIVAKQADSGLLVSFSESLLPAGVLWINALRMLVIPLIVAYIVTAIASFSEIKSTFRIGGSAVLIHLVLICSGIALLTAMMPPVVSLFQVTPEITEALSSQSINIPLPGRDGNAGGALDSIANLLPQNLFSAAANEDIFPLVIATILFSLALTRVSVKSRKIIVGFFDALIEALHVLIGWILMAMPFAVFILIFSMSTTAGTQLLSALVFFVIAYVCLSVFLIFLFYIITPILGKVSFRSFAQGLIPAQTVAVGTRSSMASLPALIEGARDRLKLPEQVFGLVMPLSVSMFKMNKAVSGPLQLFFLAHIYGIQLDALTVLLFLLGYILFSFIEPGIPSGARFTALPLYLAAGIPIEGYVILKTVDAIPDIFKTLLNVTEDMSVAVIVTRFLPGAATVPEPAGETS